MWWRRECVMVVYVHGVTVTLSPLVRTRCTCLPPLSELHHPPVEAEADQQGDATHCPHNGQGRPPSQGHG